MNYYNQIAKSYNELYQEEQINKLLSIKNNIKINKNTKILDVGCGNGVSSQFDCKVVGVDPSEELVKQNPNQKIIGTAEALPLKNSSFDLVISITAIHNFKNIRKSISEMKRVGKEKFVFSVLRKSKRFELIKKSIKKSFKVDKMIEEGKDTIFLCRKRKLYI